MFFELMSDGTMAKLPKGSSVSGDSDAFTVTLLLPYKRYLSGRLEESGFERWFWGKLGGSSTELSLYESRDLELQSDGTFYIHLPKSTVKDLRDALLEQLPPPGEHVSTVVVLRGLMRDNPAFAPGVDFKDEELFARFLETDKVLYKGYWTLRFALSRGEFEAVARLRSWLKAGATVFETPENRSKVWFSLTNVPDEQDMAEVARLSFSGDDLRHMLAQNTLPLLMFNPRSGYLILSRLTWQDQVSFYVWAFATPSLWGELKERRQLSMRELVLALWGRQDVEKACLERQRYGGCSVGGVLCSEWHP